MRDPLRIPRILNTLQQIWEMNPDLRLGQLLDNARVASGSHGDIFYIEDTDIEIGLRELAKRVS